MPRSSLIRLTIAGASGALGAAAVLALLNLLDPEAGFSGCTALTGSGWLVPIIAGAVIGTLGYALSSDRPLGSSDVEARSFQAVCSQCGGIIRGDWRLCPHCGARLSEWRHDG